MASIGMLGLGHLGLPLALALDAVGHTVHAWDDDEAARLALSERASQPEPGLDALLDEHSVSVTPLGVMLDLAEVVVLSGPDQTLGTTLTELLAVGAPLLPTVVVVTPTAVGRCRYLLDRVLPGETALVYAPQLVQPGRVLADLRRPSIQIMGGALECRHQVARVLALLRTMQTTQCVQLLELEPAELAVISLAVLDQLQRGFANEVALLAGHWGADVDEVLQTVDLALTPHGASWPRRTLAAGQLVGGDFLRHWADAGGSLGRAAEQVNTRLLRWLAEQVGGILTPRSFSVLGRNPGVGEFLASSLLGYRWTEAPAHEADVVVLAEPLRQLNLCDKLKAGAHVLDLHRGHRYLASCGFDWHGFGVGRTG